MERSERDYIVRPFPAINGAGKPETHYSVFAGDRIIAFCVYESSAILVRDDAIRRDRIAERRE